MADRPSLPTRKAIIDHWRDWFWARHDDPPEDYACFACGFDWGEMLDRAHITARCNGGTDSVENLHLLCRTCHRASEYIEGDAYFEWLQYWGMFEMMLFYGLRNGDLAATRYLRMMREPA